MACEAAKWRRHLRENPETETASPEMWLAILAWSEEALAYYRAVQDHEAGNSEPLKKWVAWWMGTQSDALLDDVLNRYYAPHGGKMPYPYVCRLLSHHVRRLNAESSDAWYESHSKAVYNRLKKNHNHRLMRSLAGYPRPLEVLRVSVPGALYEAEHEGYWGGATGDALDSPMLGAVERLIVEDNRPLRDTRKRQVWRDPATGEVKVIDTIVSLDALLSDATSICEDLSVGCEYDGVEEAYLLQGVISRADLTPAETEVLDHYLQDLTPTEIADERSVARNTIDVHMKNIRSKLASFA